MFTKSINSAATTNGQSIARRGTEVFSLTAFNNGGAIAYIKLYNTAVGTGPVVGTDTPYMIFAVPAGGNLQVERLKGVQYPAGLGLAITNLPADSDTTAVVAGQVKLLLVYGG